MLSDGILVVALMDIDQRAELYAKASGQTIQAKPFDGGDDGSIWYTDRRSVVKAFHRVDNYEHELECYQRLRDAGVGDKIRDFNLPRFLGSNDDLLAIEMGVVFPPYILDFGKAYLSDPQWPTHVVAEWNERMVNWWGSEVKRVRLVLFALRGFGIWYYDAKPGNVMVENWNPSLDD
jgi:hypothetical protein